MSPLWFSHHWLFQEVEGEHELQHNDALMWQVFIEFTERTELQVWFKALCQ